MKTGPIEIAGDVYIVDRDDPWDQTNGILAGQRVGRLRETLAYRLGSHVQFGKKSNESPSWSRITGDFIELEATFVDWTDKWLQLITNGRSVVNNFSPGATGRKYGHLMRPDDYTALVIRDVTNPLDHPLLYIPYALCVESGWLAARAGKHVEMATASIISVAAGGDDVRPYDYGDVTLFPGYPEA
jgi:hypothetical protein